MCVFFDMAKLILPCVSMVKKKIKKYLSYKLL